MVRKPNGVSARIDKDLRDVMQDIARENNISMRQVSRDIAKLVRNSRGKKLMIEKIVREIQF